MSKITVITKTTNERNQETKELFEKIKPLLDDGMIYSTAVKKVTGRTRVRKELGWFKELIEYGESQGYSYREYSASGGL